MQIELCHILFTYLPLPLSTPFEPGSISSTTLTETRLANVRETSTYLNIPLPGLYIFLARTWKALLASGLHDHCIIRDLKPA